MSKQTSERSAVELPSSVTYRNFPRTRYQGSKYKLLPWLADSFQALTFDTALDVFGGTAAVSYLLKTLGKTVYYNDALAFNAQVGTALIENASVTLDEDDVAFIFTQDPNRTYRSFIEETFSDIYFTDEENHWLDIVVQNIHTMECPYKRAMAFWALFQSAISKRPYNLFHRKNLYVRTSNVKRSFGNKATWDRPFDVHFRKFVREANNAVFDNGRDNKVFCSKDEDLQVRADLVYMDPPYIPEKGALTRYRDFYHFLEGICFYHEWKEHLDRDSKHLKLQSESSNWECKEGIHDAFDMLFEKFEEAIMVVSYRKDGIPSIDWIVERLEKRGKQVEVKEVDYKYVLSKKGNLKEVLIVAV